MHFGDYSDAVTTLAEDLVNSYSYSQDQDSLDRTALNRMAIARGWHGPAATFADVAAARALRPRLRAIFEASDEATASASANELVNEAGLVPQLVRHDGLPWHVHLDRSEATLPDWLAAVASFALIAVIERGDANRLHRCAGPSCHAVFVDVSRNRSRQYCSPAVCGNRVHAAAHRARRKY
jgi:predicted RNA-binding Zn ribbon-like protein